MFCVMLQSGSLLGSFFLATEVCLGTHLVPMEIGENSALDSKYSRNRLSCCNITHPRIKWQTWVRLLSFTSVKRSTYKPRDSKEAGRLLLGLLHMQSRGLSLAYPQSTSQICNLGFHPAQPARQSWQLLCSEPISGKYNSLDTPVLP